MTLALLSVLSGCYKGVPIVENDLASLEIPEATFLLNEVRFDRSNSQWFHPKDSSKVSGYVVSRYPDGAIAEKFGVVNGRKEGVSISYFVNGQVRFSESFRNNRLNGEVKRWTLENGYQLVAQLNYKEGKLDGEQKKWYSTGELHKLMNLSVGREEGLQQAFRKNGALYANYEARNGRVFGMKRSNLCYELDNEKVVYNQ